MLRQGYETTMFSEAPYSFGSSIQLDASRLGKKRAKWKSSRDESAKAQTVVERGGRGRACYGTPDLSCHYVYRREREKKGKGNKWDGWKKTKI